MSHEYVQLLDHISRRYGVSREQIDRRVQSRRARTRGLLGPRLAAHTVSWSLALGGLEALVGRAVAASGRHVNGLQEDDVVAAATAEVARGCTVTLGYWAVPGESAGAIAAHYVRAVQAVAHAALPASVSIKVDQLGYDPGLLMNVLDAARDAGVRVHFDAQGHETVDRTHALAEDAACRGRDVSITLPSRFRRSLTDAERFIRLGLPVRLVKGQGGDPEDPRIDPRQSFVELARCLAGRAAFVGVATHDRRTAGRALDTLLQARTSCGLEQMRSLPRLDAMAHERHIGTRVYIAYGHAGLPYAIAELARRPAIAAWILRDLMAHRAARLASRREKRP